MEVEREKVTLVGEFIPALNEVIVLIDNHKRFQNVDLFVQFRVPENVTYEQVRESRQIFIDVLNKKFLLWIDGEFVPLNKVN
jgi:hypothetical protein